MGASAEYRTSFSLGIRHANETRTPLLELLTGKYGPQIQKGIELSTAIRSGGIEAILPQVRDKLVPVVIKELGAGLTSLGFVYGEFLRREEAGNLKNLVDRVFYAKTFLVGLSKDIPLEGDAAALALLNNFGLEPRVAANILKEMGFDTYVKGEETRDVPVIHLDTGITDVLSVSRFPRQFGDIIEQETRTISLV